MIRLPIEKVEILLRYKELGAVNRVRKAVYVAISKRRRELNGAAPSEPTGNKRFPNWPERFAGGSAAAERAIFAGYARDIQEIQLAAKDRSGAREIVRAFYVDAILTVPNAVLKILPGIESRFEVGYFRGNAEYRNVIVRLSSSAGKCGA